MDVVSVSHRGLSAFLEKNDARGLKQDQVPRLRSILTALIAAEDMESLEGPPGWRVHQLKGDRAGVWSISVSGNWRLTFRIVDGDIAELNVEDYH